MSADIVTADELTGESAALQWAIDFFRKNAEKMTRGKQVWEALMVDAIQLTQIMLRKDDGTMTEYIEEARASGAGYLLAQAAAILIESGEELSKPMRDFVIDFLKNPSNGRGARGRGPSQKALFGRDLVIGAAVGFIAQEYGFPRTRNRATNYPCAASIVQRALAESIKLHVSESNVVRTWDRFREEMKSLGGVPMRIGDITVGRPGFFPEIPSTAS
jgi:hypothetical protein